MEKIKSDLFRYRIFCFQVAIVAFALNFLIDPKIYWISIPFAIVLSYLLPLLTHYAEKSKKLEGIYFSDNGIDLYNKNILISHLSWGDIEVYDVKTFRIKKSLKIQISSITNPAMKFNIPVTWFVEKSIIDLTKKYAPETSSFYKRIKKYTVERNINF